MSNSDIHKMMEQQFQLPNHEEWVEVAERSLKGKTLDSLKTETAEGITLNPLYTNQNRKSENVRPTKRKWTIAQPSFGNTGCDWLTSMKDSLEKGNEAIYLDGRMPIEWGDASIEGLAELMLLHPITFIHITSDDRVLTVFDRIQLIDRHQVSGLLLATEYELSADYRNVRSEGIDLESIHMNGADSVTELAFALTRAAELATKYTSFEEFSEEVFFRFPADTHFFMEISKFRAFRTLWELFCSAYDSQERIAVPILGVTSLRSFSKIDPYVNLLRAGNSAFSAVLGGTDWLTVYPYNELIGETSQSLRYARNVQLIIREESHADKIADPAGGSYFIEQLTEELVRNAWQRFLELVESGGTQAFLQSDQLHVLAEERKNKTATGKTSLIGTSVYADASSQFVDGDAVINGKGRPAYPFEELRKRAANQPIDIRLLVFGSLKSYKPRADFAAGFLATAGLSATHSPAFEDTQSAIDWMTVEKPDYVILCADKEMTEQVAGEVSSKKPIGVLLDVAGQVSEELTEDWKARGLDGFVYNGQNRIQKITQVLDRCKGGATV
ncbi:methylmalonyl-CoA mutase family protein [Sporosarcina sp. A2]|uniref:methylmalonyl-CoA mutase family protein n=1 Tax=Sporosarcina sp. A2 TaxID=3393449 RepID=UPI003D7B9477